ncbi:OprO/OprP family phosphate-selective porin [Belliella sp. DSM 111904]|uniref:OprO/OprP family phosphate-selective porin n=1 Tax=Belliella filtrata TaxID=2923435 RepID=A0ABS9V457_9BACT|nr:porin [Belliella filtrata]MCH7411186.1 OprO/OprP family phosphate-selective porin [Belliella filtrata]
MQNRAGFNSVYSGTDLGIEQFEMRVRRLRLRLDGYVLNPKFQYYIQLAFSKADMDLETGNIAQPVRDAILYYTVNDNLYLGFGQSKLPGNRERVISSGNLQFADRSIVNSLFTLDRDFGLFGYYTLRTSGTSLFLLKGAISSGDGRNASAINNGLAYTGRVEALPFGVFKNSGDYSEGDLEFEESPKLSLGLTLSENQKAVRTAGQLGADLFAPRNLSSFIVDAMLKYRGWGVMSEYMQRSTDEPITSNSLGDIRYVIVGHGVNTHLSKMISRKSEMAFRYAYVVPNESISGFQDRVDEVLLGYTHYLNGHRIKVQGNLGYRWLEGLYQLANSGNSWTGMFQVEFGI